MVRPPVGLATRGPGRPRAQPIAERATLGASRRNPPAGRHALPPSMTAPDADFTLDDQFGRPHAVRFADAPFTLLVFGAAATAADAEAWGSAAAAALPDVRVVAVAAVGTVPNFVRPLVRRALAGRPPVPLDWGDVVAARYGFRAGAARAVLVDAAGRVRAAAAGAPTPALVAELAAARGPVRGPA